MPNNKNEMKNGELAKKIIKWAISKEGEQKLKSANKNSCNAINELKKALVVDNEMLHTAFNL